MAEIHTCSTSRRTELVYTRVLVPASYNNYISFFVVSVVSTVAVVATLRDSMRLFFYDLIESLGIYVRSIIRFFFFNCATIITSIIHTVIIFRKKKIFISLFRLPND